MLEGHTHSHNARANGTGIGELITDDGPCSGIDDKPDVSFDSADFDVGFVTNQNRAFIVRVGIDKGLDTDGGGFTVVGDHLVGNGDAVDILQSLSSLSQRQSEVDAIGKAQGHDISVVPAEFQRGSILREGGDIHLEEIHSELTVDVMQLIFIFTVVLTEIGLINFLQVVKVVGTFRVHAFMDDEMLPVLFTRQCMGAVRALKREDIGETVFIRRKECSADLAHQLSGLAVVAVEIGLWSITGGTGTILRDIAHRAALNGFNRLTILPGIVGIEILPVPVLVMVDDLRELIHLELLVLGRMGIVEGPLLKGDKFADKVDQPAVLLKNLVA